MTHRIAWILVCASLALPVWPVVAGTVGSESSIGIESAYNSNPLLLPAADARSAESVAILANLPATYTGGASTLELRPRLRLAATHGAQALLSDYHYFDGLWKLTGERNVLAVNADWHRESTLYNKFENSALSGRNVRRTEAIGSADWRRLISERSDTQLRASFDQVRFGQNAANLLYSYDYGQAAAQYDRTLSERLQMTLTAGISRYKLRDYSYQSDNRFVQLGVARALSEHWLLSAQAGYSRLDGRDTVTRYQIVVGPNGNLQVVPVTTVRRSTARTGNYALSLERRAERLTLSLVASRDVTPSGLGALVTQNDLSIGGNFNLTERLSLGATLHGSRLSDALGQLQLADRRFYDADVNASWQWTEHWILQFQAAINRQRLAASIPIQSGNALNLTVSRQFGRVRLN